MRPASYMCGLMLIFAFSVFAEEQRPQLRDAVDEPAIRSPEPSERLGGGEMAKLKLLKRIDQLEKRVAELESRLAQIKPTGPVPRAPSPYRQPAPRDNWPYQPTQPPQPQYYRPTPVPPPTDVKPPKHFQRFEFNGQYFYIIPVDQIAPSTTSRTDSQQGGRPYSAPRY